MVWKLTIAVICILAWEMGNTRISLHVCICSHVHSHVSIYIHPSPSSVSVPLRLTPLSESSLRAHVFSIPSRGWPRCHLTHLCRMDGVELKGTTEQGGHSCALGARCPKETPSSCSKGGFGEEYRFGGFGVTTEIMLLSTKSGRLWADSSPVFTHRPVLSCGPVVLWSWPHGWASPQHWAAP